MSNDARVTRRAFVHGGVLAGVLAGLTVGVGCAPTGAGTSNPAGPNAPTGSATGAGAAAGSPVSSPSAAASPAVAAGASPAPNRITAPITIEYWHINTENFGGPTVKELVRRFQELNPNVTVREQFQPNSYTGLLENLQTSLAGNNPPDVAQIGYLYIDYVTNNFPFVTAEELARKFDDPGYFDAFPENILRLGQINGRQVAMPYAISNTITYYNADLFRQAGLDPDRPPQTWAEWRAASAQIKARTGKQGVYIQILDDNWTTQALIESNGGRLLACEGGTVRAAFDRPEAVEAIQFWAELIKDGLSPNVLATQGEAAFLGGEVAAYVTTIARRDNFQRQAPFDLRATGFPRFGDKKLSLPAGGNCLFVFSKDEARQRAAWEFIKFLESPEGLTIWTKGTGYLPPRKGVADDPQYLAAFLRENPIQKVAVDQTPNVVAWVSFPGPNGLQASKTLFSATQEAFGGQATTAAALQAAASRINALMAGQPCP